jgi:hypothetical protein
LISRILSALLENTGASRFNPRSKRLSDASSK